MKYLNLTPGYDPANPTEGMTVDFKSFFFGGGEPHIKLLEDSTSLNSNQMVTITTRLTCMNDLGTLMVAVDALRRMNVSHIELFTPYLPGARQDRVMVPGEPLTVKVYADIINSMELSRVRIIDCHSDVGPALINNCVNLPNNHFVHLALAKISDLSPTIISPDAGANKKVTALGKWISKQLHKVDLRIVKCDKDRDVSNGEIKGFEVYADDLEGRTCVIVDDICANGGTFMGLAEELKKKNAGKIYLVVTHGEFGSNPLKTALALDNHFDGIYTTDSMNAKGRVYPRSSEEIGVFESIITEIPYLI